MDLSVSARTVILRIVTPGPIRLVDVYDYLREMPVIRNSPKHLTAFVSCVQRLVDQLSARITFCSRALATEFVAFMSSAYPDFNVSLVEIYRKVVLRFLPVELAASAVKDALSTYGSVISHTMCSADKIHSGTRVVTMKLLSSIPSRIVISGHSAVTYYSDQPRTCFACGLFAHQKKDCPSASSSSQSSVSPAPLEHTATISPEPVVSVPSTVALECTQNANSTELKTPVNAVTLRSNSLQVAELSSIVSSEITDISQSVHAKPSPPTSSATYANLGDPFDSPSIANSICKAVLHYLPFELSAAAIRDAFSPYGTVLSLTQCQYKKIPNGLWELVIDYVYEVPSDLYILGHLCVVAQ